MLVVAGLSLKNLNPHVWDPESPYYIPALEAVMVSYADIDGMPRRRQQAMEVGLRAFLGIPEGVRIFLDNGSFYFARKGIEVCRDRYDEFVAAAKPDWYPIPQDFIPSPSMGKEQATESFRKTMDMNEAYADRPHVPVIHVGTLMSDYMCALKKVGIVKPTQIALGGIVPNLLRAPKALPYQKVLAALQRIRQEAEQAQLHLFGVGGTSTLHIAHLLGMNSIDSAGWRNRAARGIIQLPGIGDRVVADLGSWRGRRLSDDERTRLHNCQCPACQSFGVEGITARGLTGFSNRATHNLWVLLEEAHLVDQHVKEGSYVTWYKSHLQNTTYKPLINSILGVA